MSTARDEFSFWWQTLGIITGSMSLISFVQKLFDIGLSGIFATFIDFYRSIFYSLIQPFFYVLEGILPFELPHWYKDAFLLSFIITIPAARTLIRNRGSLDHAIRVPVVGALISLPLLGFLILPVVIAAWAMDPEALGETILETSDDEAETLRRIGVSIACVCAASIAFFVLNHQIA